MNIPITKLCLGEDEVDAVRAVLKSGWLVQGDKVEQFEDMVKVKVGTKYAVACGNCTEALHMSVLALGIGRGDRVAVPAYTFVATPNAVEYVGGIVEFVDINLETFNINANSLWEAGWGRFRAVIPVHLFGLCADMTSILEWRRTQGEILADGELCRKAEAIGQGADPCILGASYREETTIIEDAACALGASCPEGMAGACSDIGTFSLHPRKSVTTGEGGMMTTNRDDLYRKVHALRDFGFEITDIERHKSGQTALPQVEMLGYNYRMTNIQGAIGVEQMKKYGYIIGERMRRAEIYNRELDGLDWVRTPVVPEGYQHTYQSYCLLVGEHISGAKTEKALDYVRHWNPVKDKLVATFKEKGISVRGGTHACHMLPYYARKYNLSPVDFPNTMVADALLVTIPLFASMTDDEQQFIIDALKEIKA
jgi:dTDP-4-amino-4,6-dideoxygalactose transaminase